MRFSFLNHVVLLGLGLCACGPTSSSSGEGQESDTSDGFMTGTSAPTNTSATDERPLECESDEDCFYGYACDELHLCVLVPKMLPTCVLPPTATSHWVLSQPPTAFGLADFDGDGDLDLYAALPTNGAVELAFNDGAGNFTGGALVDAGPQQTDMQLGAADLDGDEDVDLAVARPDTSDLILLFNQGGKLTPGPILGASAAPSAVIATDVNLDGNADLVAVGGNLGSISVWFSDGTGGFGAEQFALDLVGAANATIVDVDGDQVPAIVSALQDTLQVFPGNKSGVWTLFEQLWLSSSGWSQALAADIDKNAGSELVAVRPDAGSGLALLYWSAQGLEWQGRIVFSTSSPLMGGRFADVTDDGFVDLVSATGAAMVAVLVGVPTIGFGCEMVFDVAADTAPSVLTAGDVDGDGRVDIVAGSRDSPEVTVIRLL